jgi:hypothetical protein
VASKVGAAHFRRLSRRRAQRYLLVPAARLRSGARQNWRCKGESVASVRAATGGALVCPDIGRAAILGASSAASRWAAHPVKRQ